jgi:hypothetical protein
MHMLCIQLMLLSMLVISTYKSLCVHADLGLCILHSDLGQPGQTGDYGKNLKRLLTIHL